jgi:hypothetical protein
MRDDKKKIKAFYEALLGSLDLQQLIKDIYLDDFDTYGDYEKYGDMFSKIEKKQE